MNIAASNPWSDSLRRPTMRLRLSSASGVVLLLALLASGSARAEPVPCAECHDIAPDRLSESVHGFLDCADCHSGAEDLPHPEDFGPVDCSICHQDTVELLRRSIHGDEGVDTDPESGGCQSCHGPAHDLLPRDDPQSPLHPSRLPDTCGTCHADPEMARRLHFHLVQPIEAYRSSVHARAIESGRSGADCSDCHGSHEILPASDPRSEVNHVQVPDTCGACHEEIAASYRVSVHGQALSHGVREAPVCTDCHGEHRILSPSEVGSPVFVTNVPKMTCGRCHGDVRLAEKFGLPLEKVPAYENSYHGLAIRSGVTTVAHCGSCHGVHDIQPSSDPRSHVHAENLAQTCGKCHPGAGDTFAIGTVHVLATDSRHAAVYYVRAFYLWLIYLAVGAMVLHNLADFYRKLRTPLPRPPQSGLAARERMPLGFRLAHGALAVSFLVLVLTGFALTYPESWWARPLLRWEGSFGLRGWLHRSAAVVMMAAFFFHFVHLALSRRARRRIAGMRPTWEDWKEFKERLRYFVGSRPDPPRTGPLGYPEKIEYLSLIWGTGIMVVTGLLLWFETAVLRWLPSWVADVATVVHFYEAVLAGLAILVWHLYFVIFDPVVYPMDTAWLTGRSPDARIHERRGE